MAERSRFWDGTTIGDATVAPYDAGTEFAEVMTAVAGFSGDVNKGGFLGTPNISSPSASVVRVGAIEALVYGTWYQNDANVDFTIPTPAAATRIDLIVLRKSWASQTVRMLVVSGAEGGAAPALVQTVGVTWDVPVARLSTTTGGAITITPTSTRGLWYRVNATDIASDNNATIQTPNSTYFTIMPTNNDPASWGGIRFGRGNSVYWSIGHNLSSNNIDGLDVYCNALGRVIARFSRTTGTFAIDPQADLQWHSQRRVIQVGNAACFVGVVGLPGLYISDNWYLHTSAQDIAPYDAPSVRMSMAGNGSWSLQIAPKPAVGSGGLLVYKNTLYVDTASMNWYHVNGPQLIVGAGAANNNVRVGSASGGSRLEAYGTGLVPFADGFMFLGEGTYRWTTVFATTPTINTSLESAKHDINLLEREECVRAVLDTDWCRFMYNPPNPPAPTPPEEGETEEGRQQREAMNAAMQKTYEERLSSPETNREFKGYVMQSETFKTHPLFGIGGVDACAGSDLGVLAAALQWALKEIQTLKGVN